MKKTNNKKTEKMNFRIDPNSKSLIQKAAELSGHSNASAYMIQKTVEAAMETIINSQEVEKIILSNQDFDLMQERIVKPMPANKNAVKAIKRFKAKGLL